MAEAPTTPPLPPPQASVGHIIPIPVKISGDVDHNTWGKWSSFDPTRADNTPSQAASVVAFLVEYYARQGLTGRDLWSEFQSDFEAWPEEAFIKTPSSIMTILRNHLRANGVYVKMDGSRIAKNVIDVISQERFHVWTQAEIDEVTDKHRSFKTLLNDKAFADDIRGGQPITTGQQNPSRDRDGPPPPPPPIDPSTNTLLHHRRYDPALDNQMPPSKQLTDLTKLYTNEMKYGGGMYDVFDSKMLIFRDNCHKAGIPQRHFAGAFSIMLRDKALAFYFDRLCDDQAPVDFHAMASRVKLHFETEESRQAYLTEWRNTTFDRVIIDNPGKSKMEVLEVMLDKLITIQRALPTAYNTEDSLRLQVLNACRGVKACELALFSPAPTYEGVCGQLRSAIGTSMAIDASPHHFTSDMPPADGVAEGQYFTDRKFNGNGKDARFGRPRSSFRGGKMGNRSSLPTAMKKCYVCKKQGCWSTKHTAEERRKAYADFKSNANVRDTSIPAYNHFLAWHEGIEDFDAPDEPLTQYLQAIETNVSDDDEGESFFTSFFNTISDGNLITAALADRSTFHALTKDDYRQQHKGSNTFTLEGRYGPSTFHGIMPDSGAAGFSTAGHPQYLALQRALPTVTMTAPPTEAVVRFGSGDPLTSMGIVTVPTPIGEIPFHVVSSNTPFLFCLEDMDRLGVRFDNLRNVLHQGETIVPIVRKWGHPWMLLEHQKEQFLSCNNLTEGELRRLHRRFGHPSVDRLHKVLQQAGHPIERKLLEGLTKVCQRCQLHAPAPSRFKFTLRDDCHFNFEVIIDVMYVEGNRPILHVVDTATSFNAARFLKDLSARHTWEALRMCWIDVYQGPPDWIVTDAGTNFRSNEFRQSAKGMSISVKEAPIEAHNSVGKVERYHAPLRRAYEIIRAEDPNTDPELALQMAVKAINDTAGPNGIIPTLLVFGSYPRITDESPPSPEITRRAEAVRKATNEIRRLHAARQVTEALATRNGPDTSPTLDLPLQSEVRVWREKKGWQGPFRLIAVDGETCTLEMPRGPRSFRSTVVKPYLRDAHEHDNDVPAHEHDNDVHADGEEESPQGRDERDEIDPLAEEILDEIVVATGPVRRRGRPRKDAFSNLIDDCAPEDDTADAFLTSKEQADLELAVTLREKGIITTPGAPFEQSTTKEVDSLIDRGVFGFTLYDENEHSGIRIFKSRIVNEVKNKTTTPYEKSRLVIQGYNDRGKETILTQSPTIQRASQRLILALAPSLIGADYSVWIRDITQAYVQSQTALNRVILAYLPPQIRHRYPPGTIMTVLKPLYGIAEAGTHWWATYHGHHRENLQMETSSFDPCLLVSSDEGDDFGIVGMQTDDTLGLSDEAFSRKEEEQLKKAAFTAKAKEILTTSDPLTFNGGTLSLTGGNTLTLRQKGQGNKLALVPIDGPDAKQKYVEQRARGAYIASICQPEACFDLSSAAQHQDPSIDDYKNLNRRLKWQMDHLDRGLTFMPVNLPTAKLFVFVDGSFANNVDFTSQLGFIIVLANEKQADDDTFTITGNIVHFSSTKSKRVTRSVLASEVYGMVAGVDMAYAISTTLRMITDRLSLPPIPTIVCTDSYSLYECLVKLGTTKEKRLMIDIMALRQSYERRELHEVRWINGSDNPADAFTKASPNQALEGLISNNEINVRMEGWVTRR
ncbi:hypothetical protein QIS74_10497 [Colletotrichum tabaci]|uniref:Integrase catalytic domain-containing protein n=1 Tax=Colletotrichum tabaci TaxID=1209068 RepID=A0AAV9T106_9PEZI